MATAPSQLSANKAIFCLKSKKIPVENTILYNTTNMPRQEVFGDIAI